jgi:hypothetical protein
MHCGRIVVATGKDGVGNLGECVPFTKHWCQASSRDLTKIRLDEGHKSAGDGRASCSIQRLIRSQIKSSLPESLCGPSVTRGRPERSTGWKKRRVRTLEIFWAPRPVPLHDRWRVAASRAASPPGTHVGRDGGSAASPTAGTNATWNLKTGARVLTTMRAAGSE